MSEPAVPAVSDPVPLAGSLSGPAEAPVLVLGNSLGTSSSLWDAQLPALTRHFRVLRYEHRGHGAAGGIALRGRTPWSPAHGYSPAPPGRYSIADLGGDVLALLDRHGIERAAYCGVSLGGMVGMWLAANAPDRISWLGLCCTSAFLPPASLWQHRAAAVLADGTASIASQVVQRWFTQAYADVAPSVVRRYVDGLGAIQPAGYAGCCAAIESMDLRPVLHQIGVPTLVLAGAEDPATPPWHGAVIASGISGSRLAVLRGASHLAVVSNAAEVTGLLTSELLAHGLR
jgi:3-oxoadipate enol-lactonase